MPRQYRPFRRITLRDAQTPPGDSLQNMPSADALRAYIEERRFDLKPRTVATWESLARKLSTLLPMPAGAVTQSDLAYFQNTRLASGAAKSTVRQELSILFNLLQRCGNFARIKRVRRDKCAERQGVALSQEEIEKLLAAAKANPPLHIKVQLGLLGMRHGEILNLSVSDYDQRNHQLTISRSKSSAGIRRIPIPASLAAQIEGQIGLQNLRPSDPLFPHRDRPDQAQKHFLRSWTTLRKKAGLEHIRFHDLRHTAITRLVEGGTPEWIIRSYVGHATNQQLGVYTHPSPNSLANATAKLLPQPAEAQQEAASVDTIGEAIAKAIIRHLEHRPTIGQGGEK